MFQAFSITWQQIRIRLGPGLRSEEQKNGNASGLLMGVHGLAASSQYCYRLKFDEKISSTDDLSELNFQPFPGDMIRLGL